MYNRFFSRRCVGALLTLLTLFQTAHKLTATSLTDVTQATMETALANGGDIKIGCDGTLVLTNTLVISRDTVIDASGHSFTFSGGKSVRVFQVNTNVVFTLLNVTVCNGSSDKGAALFNNGGNVTVSNCVFATNTAIAAASVIPYFDNPGTNAYGGAIFNLGLMDIENTIFVKNSASAGHGADTIPPCWMYGVTSGGPGGNAYGGALFSRGSLKLSRVKFLENEALGGDGGSGRTNYQSGSTSYVFNGGNGGAAMGGGLFSYSSFTATNCLFQGNRARGGFGGTGGQPNIETYGFYVPPGIGGNGGDAAGAAVSSFDSAAWASCAFVSNSACGGNGGDGGKGISSLVGASAGADAGNGGVAVGGGILASNIPAALNCTFFANQAQGGNGGNGGIGGSYRWGQLVYPSGAAGIGQPAKGGAIAALNASFDLKSTTIVSNSCSSGIAGTGKTSPVSPASVGGGIYTGPSEVVMANNILAFNVPGNCAGTIHDLGGNLSTDHSCNFTATTSLNDTDPLLGPLADNGGDTLTFSLLPGSPAIDGGEDQLAPTTDQRFIARPKGAASDIGSFEYSSGAPIVRVTFSPPLVTEGQTTRMVYTLANPNAFAVTNIGFTNILPAALVPSYSGSPTNGHLKVSEHTISLNGATLAGNETCIIAIDVTCLTFCRFTNQCYISSDFGISPIYSQLLTVDVAPSNVLTNAEMERFVAATAVGGTVTIACDGMILLTNPIVITKNTTLDASGHQFTVSGGDATRLFQVSTGAMLVLKGMTLAHGNCTNGGAIYNEGSVRLDNCIFKNNIALGTAGDNGRNGTNGIALDVYRGTDAEPGENGKPGIDGCGGAIFNTGTLTAVDTYFCFNQSSGGKGGNGGIGGNVTYNSSYGHTAGAGGCGGSAGSAFGGVIYNSGRLFLTNNTFANNSATGASGGTGGASGLTLNYSRPSPGEGGAAGNAYGAVLYNCGEATLVNQSFSSNKGIGGSSGDGGPYNYTCQVHANPPGGSSYGGAICNNGSVTAINCTIVQNLTIGGKCGLDYDNCDWPATNGVGYGSGIASLSGVFTIGNSILANGLTTSNVYGAITDLGHNISSDLSGNFASHGGIDNVDPLLGPLGYNGGSVPTIGLLDGSPAIDAGESAFSPQIDARGITRPNGVSCDVGAFEGSIAPVAAYQTISPQVIAENQSAYLEITLTNKTSATLLNLHFTNTLAGAVFQSFTESNNKATVTLTNDTVVASGIDLEANQSYTLTLTLTSTNWGRYTNQCVVYSNEGACGELIPATLEVQKLPRIVSQPESQTVVFNTPITLSVQAIGSDLCYQWRVNGTDVAGATNNALTISAGTERAEYTVVVSNAFGSVTSSPAAINLSLVVSGLPDVVYCDANDTAVLSVVATGIEPLTYQWQFASPGWIDIPGATTPNLTITNADPANEGYYCVIITAANGAQYTKTTYLVVKSPPIITSQPLSHIVAPNSDVTFTVSVTGSAPFTYQWFLNGTAIPDSNTRALTLAHVQASDAGTLSVIVSNSIGFTVSSNAVLTICVPPTISEQPKSAITAQGGGVIFSVVATGSDPLAYQWQFNGKDIPGATSSTLPLREVHSSDVGAYTVVVTNFTGSIQSTPAYLTLLLPPTIVSQPNSQEVNAGTNVTFTVSADKPDLSYQWRFNETNIPGATSPTLILTNVQIVDSGSYSVVLSNPAGSVLSSNAVLVVRETPTILRQPQSQALKIGANLSLSVDVWAISSPEYQWRFNGNDIKDATNSVLTWSNIQMTNAGDYVVLVICNGKSVLSDAASLTVIETNSPTVTITSPKQMERVTTNPLKVYGKGSDASGLSQVLVSVNGGAVQPAVGTTNWSLSVSLLPGTNWITVNAIDRNGNVSVQSTRMVFYASKTPLTLATQGNGTISRSFSSTNLVIGQTYTVTAVPKSGSVFSSWSGTISSESPKLTFLMQSNLFLQANFVASPFVEVQGTYNGLFSCGYFTYHDGLGAISLKVTPSGAFSGKLTFEKVTNSFAGQFDVHGVANTTVRQSSKVTLTTALKLDFATSTISGAIASPDWFATLNADRNPYSPTHPASNYMGHYTLTFAPQASALTGDGIATAVIDSIGNVKFTGNMADGTTFTRNTTLSEEGKAPLFIPLNSGAGSLWAKIHFGKVPVTDGGSNWLAGVWTRRSNVRAATYPDGITNIVSLTLSPFMSLPKVKVIDLEEATVVLSDEQSGMFITNQIHWATNDLIAVSTPSTNQLRLAIDRKSGVITGTFRNPITKALTPIKGVLLQTGTNASGYFLNGDHSGRFTLGND